MSPTPTGRIDRNASGTYDLVLSRTFEASAEDVWASVTEPDRTARWFGRWEGTPGTGKTIRLQMGFEDGAPWSDLYVDACEPPRHLAVSATDASGEWHLELTLTEFDGSSELTFVQHLTDPSVAESTGPGWEYYLDLLVASRAGHPLPDFEDYYPAQAQHYADYVLRLAPQ